MDPSATGVGGASVPGEGAAGAVVGDAGLEEVLLLDEVHRLAHPGERVLGLTEQGGEAELTAAAVGDEPHVLLDVSDGHAENAPRHRVPGVGDLQVTGLAGYPSICFNRDKFDMAKMS